MHDTVASVGVDPVEARTIVDKRAFVAVRDVPGLADSDAIWNLLLLTLTKMARCTWMCTTVDSSASHEMPLITGRRPAGGVWGAFTASAGAAVAPGATAVLTLGCGRC